MLHWMSGLTLKGRFKNKCIRDNLKITPINEKMREIRLRWFSHIGKRPNTAPMRKVERLQIEGTRRRRKPLKHGGKG